MTSPLIKICETPTSETQILESECATYPFQKHPSRKPTIFGLWRCSTDIQDQERQVIALREAGATRIFGDKITGTSDFDSRPDAWRKCNQETY